MHALLASRRPQAKWLILNGIDTVEGVSSVHTCAERATGVWREASLMLRFN